jgi:steroid delta-isomerase-like uncharacterized protein
MKHVNKLLPICVVVLGLVCAGCTSSSTRQLEENKALIRRVMEEMEKQNWAAFMELHTPDFVLHTPSSPKPMKRDEFEKSMRIMYALFPDFSPTIEDIIAEGNKVVIRETCRGTNKGEFMGTPATGKEMTLPVTIIFRIADGKIAEAWEAYDMMSMMQQLGVMPPVE